MKSTLHGVSLCLMALSATASVSAADIVLDRTVTYQTITGWEAWVGTAHEDNKNAFNRGKNGLFDIAYEAGFNRMRLQVRAGEENPVDYFTPYNSGQQPQSYWYDQRYNIVNDNSDPFTINPNGFQFRSFDYDMEQIVMPFKRVVEANGEQLYLNLNYVDFGSSAFEHSRNPEEYAEFILATFQHIDRKYGIVPDALEVKLEAGNIARGDSTWHDGGGRLLGQVLVAAANRLKQHGYTPDFIAPSSIGIAEAAQYFDALIQVSGARQYLDEIAYHRYQGGSATDIARRGTQYGLDTSMLEWWASNNTYRTLHEDLKLGNNSAWQQGPIAGRPAANTPITYVLDNGPATIGDKTKFTRQYFKFIRAGAFRIEARSSNGTFDPLAFINRDGRYVTVVKAVGGGSFSIAGLPAGRYGLKYTTDREYDVDLTDQTIASGQELSTAIPAAGVLTVYAKSATQDTVPPAAPGNVRVQ